MHSSLHAPVQCAVRAPCVLCARRARLFFPALVVWCIGLSSGLDLRAARGACFSSYGLPQMMRDTQARQEHR